MLDLELFREYCLSKTGVEECFPFDEETLVFKVAGKMFALIALEKIPLSVNLKCDPEYSEKLRDDYESIIIPGFHMNKKHWNTIFLEGDLEEKLFFTLVDHSYDLVRSKLTRKLKAELDDIESLQL